LLVATARLHAARRLVGRDALLVQIGSRLADLDESRGALVLLTGEAGIGKTRLAEEIATRARASGARVAWATCWQGEGAPPLWPWVQILRQLVGSEQVLRQVRAALPGASAAAQFAQSEAVAQEIRDVASRGRLVVVLDDLHWADAASVRVLTFVASATRDNGCLLIGAYRTNELDKDHVATLTQVGTNLAVPRLPRGAALDLLRAATSSDVSAAAADAIVERSSGNPLFVWEFGQLMAESGRFDVAPAAVPDAITAVIERRLARLAEDAVAVLRVAAVAGKSFSIEAVAAVGELAVDQASAALEDGVATGVIVREGPATFAFSHDVVHEVLLAGIDHRRANELHRRAAAVSEKLLATDHSFHAVVADHLDRAGPDHAEAATVQWELAARRASAMLAYDEAAAFFARAATSELADTRRRTAMLIEQGDALLLAGDLEAARQRFGEAADLARSIAAPDLLAQAVLGIGTGPVAWEVPIASDEQTALVADALDALPDDAVELRSMLLARLSVAAATPETTEAARRRAEAALALAQQVDDGRLIAQALAAVNDSYAGPTHTMRRRENADTIVELAVVAGDRMLEALGYRFRIVADLEVGDIASVDRDIAAFSRLADQLRQPLVGWYVPLFRGMRALLDGDLGAAERHHDQVAEAAKATASLNADMMARTLLLGIQVADGRRPEPDALGGLFDIDPADWASYASGLAMVSCHAGYPDRARELLKLHADNDFVRLGDDGEHLTTLVLFGRVAVELGERSAAEGVYALLLPHADLWAVDGIAGCCWGPIELELARIALALDQVADARAHLGRARDTVERARARLLLRDVEALEQQCEQLGPSSSAAPSDVPDRQSDLFRRDGQFWTLSYGGRLIRMNDSKGLTDLARLLERPGQEIHVLDLAGPGADSTSAALARADLGELLDARARAEYRRRVAELEDELAEAEARADLRRAERARAERDFIAAELASALGLGGRARRPGDPVERARKAVTGRIRLTIGRIESAHPELARHLTNAVRTGTFCVYRPERPVDWSL
jgi:hypothetical protein